MRERISERLAEVVFAARRLWRAPTFTLMATLLLGVGMAIAAAMASVANVVLFKRPVVEHGLVHVAIGSHSTSLPREVVSAVLSDPPASLAELAGFGTTRRASAVAAGVSRPVTIEAVAGPYFALFNAVPVAGRLIHDTDVRNGAMVAVISDRFWRASYDASPAAIGSTISIASMPLTIAGVVAGSLRSGRAADVWVPSHVLPVDTLFGRLAPGVTIEQGSAEVGARYGPFVRGDEIRTLVVREGLTPPLAERDYEITFWFMAVALAISLVASASFGLLLFARMAATQSDMAVRLALGATSRDLTRLLAFEVLLIAIAASVVATNVGGLLAHFVMSQARGGAPLVIDIDVSPDWRVFTFVAAVTMVVALAVVARLAWRVMEVAALGSMVATGGMGGATMRTAGTSFRLVIAQSAATTALLLFAALIARAALPSRTFTHGLDPDGAAIAWIDQTGPIDTPDPGQRAARAVLEAAIEISGVRHAALISSLPGAYAPAQVLGNWRADVHYVSAAAFDAFGLVVTQGRMFTAREDEDGTSVALVGQAAARRFWPAVDAVGRRLEIARGGGERPVDALVIGIVSDGQADPGSHGTRTEPRDVYLPIAFRPRGTSVALLTRGNQDAGVLADRLRVSLQQALPDVAFLSVQSLAQNLYERYAPPPYLQRILLTLGLLIFVVAIGGLYGLTSYLATMRRREIRTRKALGATTAMLCRMVARESSRVLLTGAGIGILAGLFLGSFFVGNATFRLFDPVAIATVAAFIYVAGLVCSITPFVRTMVERNVALRE